MRAAILSKFISNGHGKAFPTSRRLWKKEIPPSLSGINVTDSERYAKFQHPPEELTKNLKEDEEENLARSEKNLLASSSVIKAVLYGSPEAQREAAQFDRTVSQKFKRKSVVHEISFRSVIPSKATQYERLTSDYNIKVKLTKLDRLLGAWRAVIGSDVDTYVRISEYNSISSLHMAKRQAHSNEIFLKSSSELTQYLRIGSLNRVYHVWQFTDLQHRKTLP